MRRTHLVTPALYLLFRSGYLCASIIRAPASWPGQRKIRLSASTVALYLQLIPGLLLFMGLHLLREFGLRERLQTRLGHGRYRLLFSVGIVVSLWLIVQGKGGAPFMLFIAGSLPHSFTRELVIHPMLIGVILWGTAHLLSNADLASVLMFGSLPLWAIVKIVSLERVRHRERASSQRPAASASPKPALQWDAAAIVLGVIAYTLFLVFHGPLFGQALIAPV